MVSRRYDKFDRTDRGEKLRELLWPQAQYTHRISALAAPITLFDTKVGWHPTLSRPRIGAYARMFSHHRAGVKDAKLLLTQHLGPDRRVFPNFIATVHIARNEVISLIPHYLR